MTDHERFISGLPANEYQVENYIANGVSGRDFEVLDSAEAPALSAFPVGYIDMDAWDAREQAIIDQQLLADHESAFASADVHPERIRSIAAPALRYEVAA